ncbi:unnamed protein product, partial [Brassica rapa]
MIAVRLQSDTKAILNADLGINLSWFSPVHPPSPQ